MRRVEPTYIKNLYKAFRLVGKLDPERLRVFFIMKTKKCTKCYEEKNLTMFYKEKSCPDGRSSKCKKCFKEYYEKNREHIIKVQQQYYEKNKEKISEYGRDYSKNYYYENLDKVKEYRERYKDRQANYFKSYYSRNKDKLLEYTAQWMKEKYSNEPLYKFKCSLRRAVYRAVITPVTEVDTKKIEEVIGCSIDELVQHITSQFTDGMNWDNYGKWHIDHIAPLSLARTEEEAIKLSHFTNLQPLWKLDNLKKGRKVTKEGKAKLKELEVDFLKDNYYIS